MHFHFSGSGAAAHTEIFQSAAKSCGFMSFKMIQGNNNICIHNGTADLGFFYVSAAFHRNKSLIRTLQAIGDKNLASGGNRIESI